MQSATRFALVLILSLTFIERVHCFLVPPTALSTAQRKFSGVQRQETTKPSVTWGRHLKHKSVSMSRFRNGALCLVAEGVSGGSSTEARKKALLEAVAEGSQRDTLIKAKELEETNILDANRIGGRWSLIYSTQTDPDTALAIPGVGQSVIDEINAVLYKFFFRFAPFLAGSQDRSRSSTPGLVVRNEQVVEVEERRVDNIVELQLGKNGPKVLIGVKGELLGADPTLLGVTFTSFRVKLPVGNFLRFPLPRPIGQLRTTFCDEEMRLSRGGRGGIFVLKRLPNQSSLPEAWL